MYEAILLETITRTIPQPALNEVALIFANLIAPEYDGEPPKMPTVPYIPLLESSALGFNISFKSFPSIS